MIAMTKKGRKPLEVVGILGDMHHPFCHKNYLEFVKDAGKRYGVTKWVCIGDELDQCSLSSYDGDPDGQSAGDEYIAAMGSIQPWYKAFPNLAILESNHGIRPFKKAFRAGIPKAYIRTYKEFMKCPEGWNWHSRLILQGVTYFHGEPHSGQMAAMTAAKANRMSAVIGHIHGHGGVNYSRNFKDEIFGLNVGCGIDEKAYGFHYAKELPTRPTLGMGVVIDGKEALFITMGS
jgi:hypothetical protein